MRFVKYVFLKHTLWSSNSEGGKKRGGGTAFRAANSTWWLWVDYEMALLLHWLSNLWGALSIQDAKKFVLISHNDSIFL